MILFINPPSRAGIYQGLGDSLAAIEPPPWCRLLASYCNKKGIEVEIFDANARNFGPYTTAEYAACLKPDLVVVVAHGHQPSASTQTMPSVIEVSNAIKETIPGIPILIVGGHAAALPEKTLGETMADFVCTGEGPTTILALWRHLKASQTTRDSKKDHIPGLCYWGDRNILRTNSAQNVWSLTEEMSGGMWDKLPMDRYRSHNWHAFTNECERKPYASIYTSLGCPYSCFSGDTYILHADGIYRLDEREYLKSIECCESNHTHFSSSDGRFISQGEKMCIDLGFSNGLHLIVTPDHKITRVVHESIVDCQVSDLKLGDWLVIEVGTNKIDRRVKLPHMIRHSRDKSVPKIPQYLTETLAWLAGYIIGDGSLPSENAKWYGIALCVSDALEDKIRCIIKSCFNLPLRLYASSRSTKIKIGRILSRTVETVFKIGLGINPTNKLRVPRVIFSSPPSVVRSFLNGLWAADGHARPKLKHSYLTTISRELAIEIAQLIMWIGDGAVIRNVKQRGGYSIGKDYYRVEWHKREICDLTKTRNPCIVSQVPFFRPHYYVPKLHRHWWRQLSTNNKPVLRARLGDALPGHQLLRPHTLYVQLKSWTNVGLRTVYDFHNHPSHKLVANGISAHNCSFCMIQSPFREGDFLKYRGKANSYRLWNPIHAVNEIQYLVDTHNVKNIKIADEMMVLNRSHVWNICQQIIERGLGDKLNIWCYARVDTLKDQALLDKMRAAGIRWCGVGIESMSEHVRDGVDKNDYGIKDIFKACDMLRKADICLAANFMFGLPDDDEQSMQQTLDMAFEIMPEWCNFYCTVAYPGTALYKQAIENGWELPASWSGYSHYAYDYLPLRTRHLTAAEVLAFRDDAFQKFYNSSSYQSHVLTKFGPKAAVEVAEMVRMPLKRKLLEK